MSGRIHYDRDMQYQYNAARMVFNLIPDLDSETFIFSDVIISDIKPMLIYIYMVSVSHTTA